MLSRFFLGMGLLYLLGNETMIKQRFFIGFTVSSLLVAGISLYDDYRHRPLSVRLVTQTVAIAVAMLFGIVITELDHSFFDSKLMLGLGYIITFIWIIGLTNTYNFMDGLNGMAGCNAVVASFFLWIISFDQGSNFTYMVCYAIMAGTSGFLIYNFPKARLFMGDVGSTFLGFSFATLAIVAALYDNAHTSFLVMPLLMFHFIFDAAFTFFRRLIVGENVFEAHRSHLYQLLNRMGWSHTLVTLCYCSFGVAQGVTSVYMIHVPGVARVTAFIPFLCLYTVFAFVILWQAKKKGTL